MDFPINDKVGTEPEIQSMDESNWSNTPYRQVWPDLVGKDRHNLRKMTNPIPENIIANETRRSREQILGA